MKVYASGVYYASGISLGGDVEYINDNGFSKWSVKFQRDNTDSSICFFSNNELIPKKKGDDKKSDIGVGYSQVLTPEYKGAVDFKINQNQESTLRFGVDRRIDAVSNLRLKATLKQKKELRVAFFYKQRVSSKSRFTASADLNAAQLFGNEANNTHLFSAGWSYGDD